MLWLVNPFVCTHVQISLIVALFAVICMFVTSIYKVQIVYPLIWFCVVELELEEELGGAGRVSGRSRQSLDDDAFLKS
jgi:hypothetical protein